MPGFDDYIVFVDESGDHGMKSIDPYYPIFVLAFCVFQKTEYAEKVVPEVLKFKFKHFGHDQFILHEREIRKSQGPFNILLNKSIRETFLTGLNILVHNSPFTLIASSIKKEPLKKQRNISNPYNIAMLFGVERIFLHLKNLGCEGGETYIIFESRGRQEDRELELEFRRICENNATGAALPFKMIMVDKRCNSAGLQLSDLIARPIGRKILNPDQSNRAYEILEDKFRRSGSGKIEGWGLKIFP